MYILFSYVYIIHMYICTYKYFYIHIYFHIYNPFPLIKKTVPPK